MTPRGAWLRLRIGRLGVRIHLGILLVTALLAVLAGHLALRYLLLLSTLLIHEAAHAGAALALGGERAVIRLWPWFGRADVPRRAGLRQALVALAAPAANLAVAGALVSLCDARITLSLGRCPLPDLAASAHLLMGAGNLLPVPPVDGGRALAALWRARSGPARPQA